jgi:hypothetical protein
MPSSSISFWVVLLEPLADFAVVRVLRIGQGIEAGNAAAVLGRRIAFAADVSNASVLCPHVLRKEGRAMQEDDLLEAVELARELARIALCGSRRRRPPPPRIKFDHGSTVLILDCRPVLGVILASAFRRQPTGDRR